MKRASKFPPSNTNISQNFTEPSSGINYPVSYRVIQYLQHMVQMAFCDQYLHRQVTNVSTHVCHQPTVGDSEVSHGRKGR